MIEELLASFNFPNREEIDKAWADEAEDRIEAYKSEDMKSKAAKEVFDNLNRRDK